MLKFIFSPITALIDRIVCVASALLFTQVPVYINQYLNALSGRLAEAKVVVEKMRLAAQNQDMNLEGYINYHVNSTDPVFQESGRLFKGNLERLADYTAAFEKLSAANIWQKPLKFIEVFERDLAKVINFEPGVPVSLEGAAYAVVGILVALLLMGLISWPFKRKGRKEKVNKTPPPPEPLRTREFT